MMMMMMMNFDCAVSQSVRQLKVSPLSNVLSASASVFLTELSASQNHRP